MHDLEDLSALRLGFRLWGRIWVVAFQALKPKPWNHNDCQVFQANFTLRIEGKNMNQGR